MYLFLGVSPQTCSRGFWRERPVTAGAAPVAEGSGAPAAESGAPAG